MYRFNIILTEICNANCTHCYMGNKKSTKSMTKKDIDIIINKIKETTESIVLTGGEIFLKKDLLFYTIKKIKEANPSIIIKLESNGSYFYKDMNSAQQKLEELSSMGVESIRFSLDPFHESGGIDLNKVKGLKELESSHTPNINFLIQDKALAIGKASSLAKEYTEKRNCMNNKNTINNPYFFVDVEGNIYICTWKCLPPIGNIIKEDLPTIVSRLDIKFNNLILQGKVLEAINLIDNNPSNKTYVNKYGECMLCNKIFNNKEKL